MTASIEASAYGVAVAAAPAPVVQAVDPLARVASVGRPAQGSAAGSAYSGDSVDGRPGSADVEIPALSPLCGSAGGPYLDPYAAGIAALGQQLRAEIAQLDSAIAAQIATLSEAYSLVYSAQQESAQAAKEARDSSLLLSSYAHGAIDELTAAVNGVTADLSSLQVDYATYASDTNAALAAVRSDVDSALADLSTISQTILSIASQVEATSAAVQIEAGARADGISALAGDIQTLTATVGDNTAGLAQERVVRADADSALTSQILALQSTVGDNTAAINSQYVAYAAADAALAAQIAVLTATVGQNTAAVNQEATTRSTQYDALAQQIQSVTATVGAPHLFAQTSTPTATSVNDLWIDTGHGNLLKYWNGTSWVPAQDAGITTVAAAVTTETQARVDADSALSTRIDNIVAQAGGSTAAIDQEAQARADADTALSALITNLSSSVDDRFAAVNTTLVTNADAISATAASLTSLTATVNGNTAAITSEAAARATEDGVLSGRIDAVVVSANNNAAAVLTEQAARISQDSALATQITQVSATASRQRVFLQGTAPVATQAGDLWIDTATGNLIKYWNGTAWASAQDAAIAANAAAVSSETTARTDADGALSGRIDAVVATTGANTAAIAAETTARTNADDALSAQIVTVSASATRQRVFLQSSQPTAGGVGDLWVNPSSSNLTKYWNGTAWVSVQDGQIAVVSAAVTTETTARASADTALSSQITALTSTVNGNTSAISTESVTRASADSTLSAQITTLTSTVNDNTSAISSEALTRSTEDAALAAQVSTVSASATRQRVFLQAGTPVATQVGDLWIDTGNGNRMKVWSGTAWVSGTDTSLATTAAVSTETSARTTADSALSLQITSLTATVNGNTSAISTEAASRAAADLTQSLLRQQLASTFGRGSIVSATAPSWDALFPPGANRISNSDFTQPLSTGWWTTWTSYPDGASTSVGLDLNSTYTLPGGHTAYIKGNGTPATNVVMDMRVAYKWLPVTVGSRYEFSAYLGAHRCRAVLGIVFHNSSGGYVSEVWSTTSGAGSDLNGGQLSPSVYLANGDLNSTYSRLWVYGAAPTGAAYAYLIARGWGNNQTTPYLFLTRPYFGLMTPDQTTPSDWSVGPSETLWTNTADNNRPYQWTGAPPSWQVVDDLRVAVNAAAISSEAYTRASADSSLTSQLNTTVASVAGNTTAIANETIARTSADSSLGSQITALTSTVNGNTASITNEATARASADAALTSQINSLSASATHQRVFLQTTAPSGPFLGDVWIDSANGNLIKYWNGASWVSARDTGIATNAAAVSTETTARVNGDNALSSSITALTSTVNGNTSAITSEATTRANADSALTTQVNTATAAANRQRVFVQGTTPSGPSANDIWFDTAHQNQAKVWSGSAWVDVRDTNIASNAAAISTEATARASGDSALSSQITSLTSTVNGNTSAITSEATTRANAVAALTSTVNSLTSTVDSNTAAITSEASTRASADAALTSSINTVSATASRQRVFSQSTAPTAGGVGDIWFDTSQNNRAKYWTGSAWSDRRDTGIATNAAAISTETTARVNGDNALTSSITALTSTVNGNTSAITSEATTRASADSSLSSQITSLTSTVNGNTSAITSEATTRANADSALTSSINTVSAAANRAKIYAQSTAPTSPQTGDLWFDTSQNNRPKVWSGSAWVDRRDSGIATNAAAVSTETTARVNGDSANAAQITSLTSTVNANTSAITSEATTRANADNALTSSINTVSAVASRQRVYTQSTAPASPQANDIWFDTAHDNRAKTWSGSAWVDLRDTGIAVNAAAVSTEATARASGDSAISSQITALTSTVNGNTSAISTESSTRASADSALSSQVTSLTSTVNGHTATLTTLQSTTNGLSLLYGVQGTINGTTGGFTLTGIAQNNGGANFALEIDADVKINGNAVINGSVTSNQISGALPELHYIQALGDTGSVLVDAQHTSKCLIFLTAPGYTGTSSYWYYHVDINLVVTANGQTIYSGPAGFNDGSTVTTYAINQNLVYIVDGVQITTGGTKTASATQSQWFFDTYGPEYAFDMYSNTAWFCPNATGWLQWQGTAGVAKAYRVGGWSSLAFYTYLFTKYPASAANAPKNWTLQGSNNGSTWTTLDTQTNQTGWADGEERTFALSNTTSYAYYRLNVTAVNGGSRLQVVRFAVYPETIATGNNTITFRAYYDATYAANAPINMTIVDFR